MPSTPAKLTHGSLVKISPPLASCEYAWSVSKCVLLFSDVEGWASTYAEILPILRDCGKVGLCKPTVVGL